MKAKICGITLSSPIMNASGPRCTTLEELIELGESESSAIVLKSATLVERGGNPEKRVHEWKNGLIQAMGLPNPGYRVFTEYIKQLKRFKKPIIGSIAGFNKEEYLIMSKTYEEAGADILEENFSCPNVGKKLLCYNPKGMKEIIREIKNNVNIPISVKLGPYVDPYLIEKVAGALEEVDCIILINSIPGCTKINIETGNPEIYVGYGGLSGKGIKPLAIGNVRKFFELTGKDIIGVGGIFNGKDVLEYLKAGAKAVQVGTAYLKEGPNVFKRLKNELKI